MVLFEAQRWRKVVQFKRVLTVESTKMLIGMETFGLIELPKFSIFFAKSKNARGQKVRTQKNFTSLEALTNCRKDRAERS